MTAFVVFNPNSANGDTGRDWEVIEQALERIFPLMSFFVTGGPTQAARMVRDALRDGHMEIVAVGGDGTINEALNGFFEHGEAISPDAVFSFVHNGNDSDLCRRFGLQTGWQVGVAHLGRARIRRYDVGRVACLSSAGAPVARYFLGSASFGLSGSIAARLGASRIARYFSLGFARWLHSRLALADWRECRVRLMADGTDEIAGIANVTLSPNGGLFDVGITQGRSRVRILGELKRGAVRRLRSVRLTAAPTLDTRGAVAVETDGESVGVLPATFQIYPSAINLRV